MVKLGIIGLGHMGGYHLSVSQLIPNIDVVGVSDLSKANLAKVKNAKVKKTHDYNEWIDLVDAVIIAVPTELHHPIAKECLLKGKHVLLEKPFTKTIEEAHELFAIAKAENLTLQVGHVERFNAAVQELKSIVDTPYLIESRRIGPFTPRPQRDSVVLDLMIHDLDLILSIVDSPVKSLNIISNSINTGFSDIAVVQLKFENNVLANITSSRASETKKRTMSIHQKDCFVHLDFTTQDISIHSHTTDSVQLTPKHLKYKQEGTVKHLYVYKDNPLKLEIEHFVKSIKGGKKANNANHDIRALKLALEIEQAIQKL
jgi:predicted dehydrogenase